MIYDLYLEHFSVLYMLKEMQGKTSDD